MQQPTNVAGWGSNEIARWIARFLGGLAVLASIAVVGVRHTPFGGRVKGPPPETKASSEPAREEKPCLQSVCAPCEMPPAPSPQVVLGWMVVPPLPKPEHIAVPPGIKLYKDRKESHGVWGKTTRAMSCDSPASASGGPLDCVVLKNQAYPLSKGPERWIQVALPSSVIEP